VAEGWRRLHNEFHNLNAAPNITRVIKSRRMRWAGRVSHMGEMRNAHKILVRKHEEKRPLGRPRSRLEDNIRMNVREMEYKVMSWMHLVQDSDKSRALVNTVINLVVP